MAKQIEHEVAYYYDSHPTLEDLMGETAPHDHLTQYLVEVLTWLFHGQTCAIHRNLNFYYTPNPREYPLVPDIAVICGLSFQQVRSWRVGKTGPAPDIVFEIASKETWDKDLSKKHTLYAAMGVGEYVAYDPNERPLKLTRVLSRRLFGWQRDPVTGQMREMALEADGRLWSPFLDSYLVPLGGTLLLTDRSGQVRLTQAQAEAERADAQAQSAQAEARRAQEADRRAEAEARRAQEADRRAEAEARRADVEAQRAQIEARRAEAEARRADAADSQAQAEARRADAEAQRAKALAERLRSLGIDPNEI